MFREEEDDNEEGKHSFIEKVRVEFPHNPCWLCRRIYIDPNSPLRPGKSRSGSIEIEGRGQPLSVATETAVGDRQQNNKD